MATTTQPAAKRGRTVNKLFVVPVLVTALAVMMPSVTSASWTAVASTGAVDDLDLGIVDTDTTTMRIKNSATLPAILNVRYNVVAVDGMIQGPSDPGILLQMRVRDNGPEGRVTARLKAVNFETGTTTTLATVDSNDVAAAPGFQRVHVIRCATIDFSANAYFVDVAITKSGGGGTPALQLLKVQSVVTCED